MSRDHRENVKGLHERVDELESAVSTIEELRRGVLVAIAELQTAIEELRRRDGR